MGVLVAPSAPQPFDPLQLALNSSGVVLGVLGLLLLASLAVWLIWFLKRFQLGSLMRNQRRFERAAREAKDAPSLVRTALEHKAAPGGRVVVEMARRERAALGAEYFRSVARRCLVDEQSRASSLMPTLGSIAASAPFVGLFGTVWGIMEALVAIGEAGSAALAVVAPAIGEALIATAVGLVAAIPATIAYNYIDRRIDDLVTALEASCDTWAEVLAHDVAARAATGRRPAPPQRAMHSGNYGG